jgi:exosortase
MMPRATLTVAAALLLLLGGLFHSLSTEWGLEGYYFYGWGVPLAAAWFFASRWRHAPPRGAPWLKRGWGLISAGLVLALLSRWLLVPSPHWRLALWAYGFGCAAALLGLAAIEGGRPWVRHFAFPILFPLIAIPWPTGPEQTFVDALTRLITQSMAALLHAGGIAAVPLGHLILLPNVRLDVGDACSGIRSIQALLALAIFLGEVFLLTFRSRCVLALGAMLAGLGLNALRTGGLALAAAAAGTSAQQYHDSASTVSVILGFLATWWMAGILPGQPAARSPRPQAGLPARPRGGTGTALLFAGVAILALPELSYHRRVSPGGAAPDRPLVFDSAQLATLMRPLPLADHHEMFRYARGIGGQAILPDDRSIEILWFEWDDTVLGLYKAIGHTPEFCMGCMGARQLEPASRHLLPVESQRLPFEGYRFFDPADAAEIHIFRLLWNNGPRDSRGEGTHAGRLRKAVEGRRRDQGRVSLVYVGIRRAKGSLDASWQEAVPILTRLISVVGVPAPAAPAGRAGMEVNE